MLSKRDLLNAIAVCEKNPKDYPDCAKLATFYTLYDHLYGQNDSAVQTSETVIGDYGQDEFLTQIAGCNAEKIWSIIDELMTTLQTMQPKLYNAVLVKIAQSK